jgi:hypothetical protein
VNRHRLLEIFLFRRLERGNEHDARIVNENVHPAVLLSDRRNCSLDLAFVLQIAHPGLHVGTQASQIAGGALELVAVSGEQCQARLVSGELTSQR